MRPRAIRAQTVPSEGGGQARAHSRTDRT